jgi:hypothetical protein
MLATLAPAAAATERVEAASKPFAPNRSSAAWISARRVASPRPSAGAKGAVFGVAAMSISINQSID